MNWISYITILFLLAVFIPFISKKYQYWIPKLSSVLFLYGLTLSTNVEREISFSWATQFGFKLSFFLDGTSLLFTQVILGVGACVFYYAGEYLKKSTDYKTFFVWLTLFMASMLGVVASNSFYLLFIFWELTSFSSYMLIGFFNEEEKSRKSALQALLVTGSGGLCLLAGLILLETNLNISYFSDLATLSVESLDSKLLFAPLLLILLGGLTKSAQFPFHFWLPNAMAAPAPVSALLHSATMVKAGVFLFLKFDPLFNQNPFWFWTLILSGGVTLALGAFTAYRQKDLKKLLAYTTIATLGLLTLLIGLQNPKANQAALVLFLAHAIYKATLFMVAGIVEKLTNQRDVTQLSGLRQSIPLLFLVGAFGALSMMGVPPFLGFISKEIILTLVIDQPYIIGLLVFGFSLMGAVGWVVGVKPFLGKSKAVYKNNISKALVLGPLFLSILSLILSFNPYEWVTNSLKNALSQGEAPVEVHLWAGFNLPLLLSIIILGLTFLFITLHYRFLDKKLNVLPLSDKLFNLSLKSILLVADRVTVCLQNGHLNRYLILTVAGVILAPFLLIDFSSLIREINGYDLSLQFNWPSLILFIIILVSTFIAIVTKKRLSAIVALGGIGYSLAAFFVLLGAPDLALTQVIVETLSVILFVFLLHNVPLLKTSPQTQLGNIVISIGFGMIVAFFTWQSLHSQISPSISYFFGENSYLKANGKNIVNVILVDFRGFDTLGEIAVLAIGTLSIGALFMWPIKEK